MSLILAAYSNTDFQDRHKMPRFCLAVLAACLVTPIASADLVTNIGSVSFTPTASAQTFAIPVSIFDNGSPGSEGLKSYLFPVEIGGDGRGITSPYFTFIGIQMVDSFGNETINFSTSASPQNYEVLVSDDGDPPADVTVPLTLFNVLIEAAPNTPIGESVSISITDSGSIPNLYNVETTVGIFTTLSGGSSGGVLAAVPEPGHLIAGIMGLLTIGAALKQGHRKRRDPQPTA